MSAALLVIAVVAGPEDADRARLAGADCIAMSASDGAMLVEVGEPARRWAMLDAGGVESLRVQGLAADGLAGLAIRTGDGQGLAGWLSVLAAALAEARRAGLPAGFVGSFEPPDIPRLLALRPDLLAIEADGDALRTALAAGASTAAGHAAATYRVFVRDLVAELPVGAYSRERGAPQRVRFDVTVEVAASPAPTGMADVFSYDVITDFVAGLAARGHVDLVETLAEDLAAHALADPRAVSLTVSVTKLDLGAYSAGVEITRRR